MNFKPSFLALAFLVSAMCASADTIATYALNGSGTSNFGPGFLVGTLSVDQTTSTLGDAHLLALGVGDPLVAEILSFPPIPGLTITATQPGELVVDMTAAFITDNFDDIADFFGFSGIPPNAIPSDISGTFSDSFTTTFGNQPLTGTGTFTIALLSTTTSSTPSAGLTPNPEPASVWLTLASAGVLLVPMAWRRRFGKKAS